MGLPLSLLWGITSILGEGDDGFGAPRRVICWDPRLVAALVGLHQSFDPSDGGGSLGWYEL
ncbi:hypothetical protein ABZS86_12575 [Streptomyces sp. NPDC005355]|uniref:hypothetical protein n=1 Tax=Streptomyces sp. NPDC005355 TaxID=3157038 RepID=UPI0033BF2297